MVAMQYLYTSSKKSLTLRMIRTTADRPDKRQTDRQTAADKQSDRQETNGHSGRLMNE